MPSSVTVCAISSFWVGDHSAAPTAPAETGDCAHINLRLRKTRQKPEERQRPRDAHIASTSAQLVARAVCREVLWFTRLFSLFH